MMTLTWRHANYIDQLFYSTDKKKIIYRRQKFNLPPQIIFNEKNTNSSIFLQSNKHHNNYYWGRNRLIDFENSKHQKLKGLEKKHNLRDHMTEAELLFTALAELSTRQIAESMNAKGLTENKNASKAGGKIAKTARLELEDKIGQKVISNKNYLKSPKRIT